MILRSSIFLIFQLSRVNCVYEFPNFFLSNIVQKYLKSYFCSSFLTSIVVKIEYLVRQHKLCKSSRKQNWRIKVKSMFKKGKFSRSEESSKIHSSIHFPFRYSLASRSFPKAKYSVYAQNSQWVQNVFFKIEN